MYFILILFFASLLGITFMIGRKLVLQNHDGQMLNQNEVFLKVPYMEEIKHVTIKNIKKHGYIGLVTTVRFYVHSSNFLKNKYRETKTKIKNRMSKNNIDSEKKEISKFLKIIGDYKQKIRDIQHRIKKEENL